MKGGKLSRAELSNIKGSCYPLEVVQNMNTDGVESSPRRSSLRVRRSGLYLGGDVQTNEIEEAFVGTLMKFSGLTLENRPKIPRMQHNKRLLNSVKLLNSVLPRHLTGIETLSDLVDIVYAGAVTVSEAQGYQVGDDNSRCFNSSPPWKRRLENKIVQFRKKIGTFHTYLATPHPSTKVMKSVKKLASEFRIKRRDPLFKDKITLLNDTLKQKIKALGNRIRRYNEKEKRNKNNRMFHQNQKRFFRDLEQKGVSQDVNLEPGVAEEYWSGVWSESVEHNEQMSWIKEAESGIPQVQMDEVEITVSDIEEVLKGTNNWATPGCDKLHNYWWKHFTNIHGVLSSILKKSLTDPLSLPPYLTQGLTYLIPKAGDLQNPNNYRPITCLPAVYKILTAVITKHINKDLRTNNLMAPEQDGGRIITKSSKELLIVDYIVTKQARKKLRNISVAWIDYRKAFDSVRHSWLLKVLKMHGVHEQVISLLRFLMQTWRTSLLMRAGDEMKESRSIKINRGVFQGDTLSAIWFCMAINPLSALLRNTEYGYVIDKQRNIRINHSLYIDDLKLYGANFEQIRRLLEIVSLFSDSIGMSFGVDKCATLEVRRGKIRNTSLVTTLMNQITIPSLDVDDSYKYLGIKQALDIKTSEMKELYRKKVLGRVNMLLRSKLNSRSLFTAINIWAIPTVAYSFGIITWSTTDLQEMDRAIRCMLTKHGVHHPHSSTIRLYLPRHQGGRGLLSLEKIHQENITTLRNYFLKKNSPFFRAIQKADQDISALRLSGSYPQSVDRTIEDLIEEWCSKALHGRYPACLKKENINKKESLTYLTAGYLFPETEGRLMAIQDQVIPIRMYQKNIAKLDVPSDRCRKCSQAPETLQHVTSSCPILAPRDYLERHNSMAKIYHQQIALKLGLIRENLPTHIYVPKPLLQNARYKLYWDCTLVTDRAVMHNRPDIALFDTEQKTCILIEFTIPADDNITKAYTEKITKYGDLAFQLRELHNLRTISIFPMIISVNGLVETHLLENTKRLCLEPDVISASQKQVILSTTRIVRKFLQGF